MIKFIFLIVCTVPYFVYSQNKDSLISEDLIGSVFIISFDADSVLYKLQAPKLNSLDSDFYTLKINRSTSVTDEIIFLKSKERNTQIIFHKPFYEIVNYDNSFRYLYIKITGGKISAIMYSNEPRELF